MPAISHESGHADTQSLEAIFRTLADRRRRFTLQFLRERGGAATVDELAYHVAAWERDAATGTGPTEARERVYTSLHLTVLPALAETGLVTYERGSALVELADLPASLEANLTLAAEVEGSGE